MWKFSLLGGFLICLSAPGLLPAQDFQRIAPKPLPAQQGGQVRATPDLPAISEGADAELLPELKGLVFVPKVSDIIKTGRPGLHGVIVENVALLDQADWQLRLAPRFGKRLTMGDLNAIMREVVLYYRGAGHPVVDVVVAEQEITSGVVQLAVVESHLGQVRTEGGRWFKAERLAGQVRLKPGDPILSQVVEDDLEWLNTNPFRTVDLIYTPGTGQQETDILLHIEDRFPLRAYTGYEDSGNSLTGANRWLLGFNYGNLWGLDHQLSYQWTFDNDLDQQSAHSFVYTAPLPWRHTASIFGAYGQSSADLPPPFDLGGETLQLSGRYAIPLPTPSALGNAFDHQLEIGFDFKNSTSNLAFGVIQVLDTDTDTQQFVLGYRATQRDLLGATSVGLTGFLSPGGLSTHNEDAFYEMARAGAVASYAYGNLSGERLTRLPAGFTSILKATAQFSSENLLPSEQLGFGGYSSVRGYEEREANVDSGFLTSLELRTPPISLLSRYNLPTGRDELQILAFWDYASGRNVNLLPGEDSNIAMSSVGPGIRWTIGKNFSMRLDYGFQLLDSGQSLDQGNSRMHIGATLAY